VESEPEDLQIEFRLTARQVSLPTGEPVGISSLDLLSLTRLAHDVSTAVAIQATARLGKRLGSESAEAREFLPRWFSDGYAPVQVTRIESGSAVLIFLLGAAQLAARFALDSTVGETTKEAWKESAWHAKLKEALVGLFGGAADQVEVASRAAQIGPNLSVEAVHVGKGERSGLTKVVVECTKVRSPELEALELAGALLETGDAPVEMREEPEETEPPDLLQL
jgi:hypothetical protein